MAAGELADRERIPGSASDLVFDDLDGVADVRAVIEKHPSRAVDNYVLSVAKDTPQVNTALVFPPIIYGTSHGPVNRRSVQVPGLAKATLQRKRGLQVGKGLSRWGNVHIHDIGKLVSLLVERAVEGRAGDESLWNLNGLYLTGLGDIVSSSFFCSLCLIKLLMFGRLLVKSRDASPMPQLRRATSLPAPRLTRSWATKQTACYLTAQSCTARMPAATPVAQRSCWAGSPSTGRRAWTRRSPRLWRLRQSRLGLPDGEAQDSEWIQKCDGLALLFSLLSHVMDACVMTGLV